MQKKWRMKIMTENFNQGKRLFLDIHVLQTVPPSCINRDDTNSPKTAVYGGVMRSRVSSQAWKRAVRKQFVEQLPADQVGIRTLHLVELLTKELMGEGKEAEEAEKTARKLLLIANIINKRETDEKTEDNEMDSTDNVKALFFISPAQIKAMAQCDLSELNIAEANVQNAPKKSEELELAKKRLNKEKKNLAQKLREAINAAPTIDMALFGRMVANDPTMNVDASCQVAHAISTHKVSTEFDYFTAVDDIQEAQRETTGAGMIGTVEFNSSTLYRYATIALHELNEQLSDNKAAVAKAVEYFVDAFIRSMPTGKQNTFANRTLPFAVMVTLREDQPVNLVGAFEKPVVADGGYETKSVQNLNQYAKSVYDNFVSAPQYSWVVGDTDLKDLGKKTTLKDLLTDVAQVIKEQL